MEDTSIRDIMNRVIGICARRSGSHFILVEKASKGRSTINMLVLGYTVYGNKCKLCQGKTGSGRCRYSNRLFRIAEKGSYGSRIANESRCPLDLILYGGITSYISPIVTEVKSEVKLSLFMSCFVR